MTPWQNLQRRFSATRLLRQGDAVETLRAGGQVTEWVVPRSRCAYALIDTRGVPPKRRAGFIELAVRRLVPFSPVQFHAVMRGDLAMVWSWPAQVLSAPTTDGLAWAQGDRALPEAVLRGEPIADGVELVALERGVDARVWRNGALVASQWWGDLPDALSWQRFLRGAGWPGDSALPEPSSSAWRDSPWSIAKPALFDGAGLQAARAPLLAAAAALLAFWLAWPLGEGLRHALGASSTESKIEALSSSLGEVLWSRDQAQRSALAVQDLLSLRAPSSQLALIALLQERFGSQGYRAVEWDMQQGRRLRLVMLAPGADAQTVVQTLRDTGRFDDVRIEPGTVANQLVVNATLRNPRVSE